MNCASCGERMTGGAAWGLFRCRNERCTLNGREIALKPMQKPFYRKTGRFSKGRK